MPPPSDVSGDLRIAAAIAGDQKAASSILSELLPRVRNLVRYFLRTDDIDDTVQESLVAILRGLGSYRGEGTLKSWGDRVVARVAIDAARRKKKEASRIAGDDVEHEAGAMPDEYLVRRQLIAALDGLSTEMREAIVLHYVLEMSVPEIAEELAIPFETVRSRLRHGRAYLRERMEKQS
jgi:RNA polymerase sigma-70 factor (ECF subfamily)